MKKFIGCIAIAMAMLMPTIVNAGIVVEDTELEVDYIIKQSKTLVPLRGIFEQLGYKVQYNNATKTAYLTGENNIEICAGQEGFFCNGQWIECEIPQEIIDGRFYVPLRDIVNTLDGYEIEWNENTKAIYIHSANAKIDEPTKEQEYNNQEEKDVIENEEDVNALEMKVVELINEERAKEGLKALKWDDKLAEVARNHSCDMAENNYFDHTNLKGESPFNRMKKAGINYRASGENIAAGGNTAEKTVEQWMNSEGHRNNIMNSGYNKVGVGLCINKNSAYGYYWTQVFSN